MFLAGLRRARSIAERGEDAMNAINRFTIDERPTDQGELTTALLAREAVRSPGDSAVRLQVHERKTSKPEALAALLARQRTAFLRDGPPSLAHRRANLRKLRAAL